MLCSTGCWFYRASRVLEAVFHLSAAFYGLDATFFFFVFLLLLLFSALPFSSFVCDSTVGRHRLAIGV